MRQIKLRAHVGGHGMTNPFMIGDLCKHIPILTSNGMVDIRNNFNDPLMTFMEFTGIKDKNGTDIYNDDILQYMGGNIHAGGYKEIGGGNYIIQWHIYKYKLSRIDTDRNVQSTKGIGMIHQRPADWEVIGNIHENPELLGRD